VHDLNALAVLLSHSDLLDPLDDAVPLARSIRADPDTDPSEDHHQKCNDRDSTTHLLPPSSGVCLHVGAEM
jgi:hypothetical protein